jgi:hypothetical protein
MAFPRPGGPDPAAQATDGTAVVVAVPVFSLRPADSPRLNGEDKAHIARLAQTETPLPPILVDRRTMRVIDGMHRLMAASLHGREAIDVIFFDGNETDVFLRAVQENIAHGLPLSQADRRAAAERIIATHPHLSDRAIGHSAGLAAKTVAAIRKGSSEEIPQSNTRVGRDGRDRITYASPETGYTIARIDADRGPDLITAVGPLPGAQVGESLRMRGRWTFHPKYGKQFEVFSYTTVLPVTVQGIQRYLGSGLIKGMGPVMAERVVGHFGVDIMHIIDDTPERLIEVDGLSSPARVTTARSVP